MAVSMHDTKMLPWKKRCQTIQIFLIPPFTTPRGNIFIVYKHLFCFIAQCFNMTDRLFSSIPPHKTSREVIFNRVPMNINVRERVVICGKNNLVHRFLRQVLQRLRGIPGTAQLLFHFRCQFPTNSLHLSRVSNEKTFEVLK